MATGGYPARWEGDVVLADGGTVHVRPITPDDGERMVAFHSRQSPESIYYRFFSPRPRLTERDVEHFTTVDYSDRMAFIALLADEMVGVARYDRFPARPEAEVAFFIDDAHQGRGMATVLLEHLAVAAREVGISAFTATVLPQNRRMVGVFSSAGYRTTSEFADGVIAVRLDLRPSPDAEAAIAARARRAESEAVRKLVSPTSVAVVGASREPGSFGHDVLANIVERGFTGTVHAVNPAATEIAGVPAVASIDDVEGPVDLAIIAIPAPGVAEAAAACGRRGVRAVLVVGAGFAEAGPEGAERERDLVATCRRHGMRLLGPNSLGVVNTDPGVRLHAMFLPAEVRAGRVALLSESGTVGAVVLDHLHAAGLGISSFTAIGNRADVSANDLLQYWADDDRTDLVLLYIESFGNPRRFGRIARELARRKPVLAVKSGRSTRAFPGDEVLPDDTVAAVLRQTGVTRVDTIAEMIDAARVLALQPAPGGDRVALVGNSGGSLVLAADACVDAGLELAEVCAEVTRVVGEHATGGWRRANPVDLGYEATAGDYETVVGALLGDPGVDAALVVCTPSPRESTAEVIHAVERASAAHPGKTVVAAAYGRHGPRSGASSLPLFDFPEAAARALGVAAARGRWVREDEGTVPALVGLEVARARDLAAGAGWLAPLDATAIVAAAGLAVAPFEVVTDGGGDAVAAAASRVGFPVVVKALRRAPLAKTQQGGIALDIDDADGARRAHARMAASLGAAVYPTVVQAMAPQGVDAAISVRGHPDVGPVLTLGPGGAAAATGRVEVRVLPLTDRDAERLVAASVLGPLLDRPSAAHLHDALLRVSALVDGVPEIAEVELDPVLVAREALTIADARVRVEPVDPDPPPAVRRLAE
jgi:acyl-CoA synthetase (NDP forming)/RimJ/RimL family protein N-acetyltransferase